MSAFLGKIHYWLFDKIVIQERITMELSKKLPQEDLKEFERVGKDIIHTKLEEKIDHGNIHGWLQERVDEVEDRFAFIVCKILEQQLLTLEEIREIITNLGSDIGKEYKVQSLEEAYELFNKVLLDGMPCDHVNSLKNKREDELIFTKTKCIHGKYWTKYNNDEETYYKLRESFINGLLKETPYRFKEVSSKDSVFYKNSISIMMYEHVNIMKLVKVIRKACFNIIKGEAIVVEDFQICIDFIKNYADAHHHGKEEDILFKEITNNLGVIGDKIIRQGMLVEHDLGRLYVKQLQEALRKYNLGDEESIIDILGNALSYSDLINRHIKKEDEVIYKFGEEKLSREIMDKVNEKVKEFEVEAYNEEKIKKQLDNLYKLEERYLLT